MLKLPHKQKSKEGQDVFKRVYEEARHRDQTLNRMAVEALDRELEGCTFKPNVAGRRRAFGAFLKEQKQFVERREAELAQRREDEKKHVLSQHTRVPTISPVLEPHFHI